MIIAYYENKIKCNLGVICIIMFDNLRYCTRFEWGVLKILHGSLIIDKGAKMCDIYVFYDSIITANISLDGHDFHNKIKI